MMMCIKVNVCILPGVVVSDKRDWISLKFIWHMTSNKTQVEFKRELQTNLDRSILVWCMMY